MNSPLHPNLPLPLPLRGSDIPSFTHVSIVKRLPEIARRVLQENELPPEAAVRMDRLLAEIPAGKVRPLEIPLAPDAAAWQDYLTPYLGQDWLEIPWFFAEHYFYVRILEATGYYTPGPGRGQDPFRNQKQLGLQVARETIRGLTAHLGQSAQSGWDAAGLRSLIAVDLWGNLTDLSRWPASHTQAASEPAFLPRPERILVDDAGAAAECLADPHGTSTRVDFLLDNVGFELVCDLCLAAALLHSEKAERVQLHVKAAPVFVSDAMTQDVLYTLVTLAADSDPGVSGLGRALQSALEEKRLVLREDVFWTSPLPLWEMPPELRMELGGARLILAKGDANYRRLIGDRHWPPTTPFDQILSYRPAPLLALRTLKSEVIVGLAPGQAEAAGTTDPDWMNDGQWGVIQYAR
jgi:uncharacterized protein with ATP-grasp and redox domains